MKTNLLTDFFVDKENKKIKVEREFAAPVPKVWEAWTQSELLDQWWAPKPWQAKTKTMDFRENGYWLYSMNGPEGEQHWARADYKKIIAQELFEAKDSFCDEQGNINSESPVMYWSVRFIETGAGTGVQVNITFSSVADLEKIIEMGFKEGFAAGLDNLDHYLSTQFKLRKQMNETTFKTNKNKFFVTRAFDAPLKLVWKAWTDTELLDQWWAPKPWKSRTKHMDFREGGYRLYAMVSPEGEEHWGRTDYKSIVQHQKFSGDDAFCDAEGNTNDSLPFAHFINEFREKPGQTEVQITTEYASEADLEKVIQMGMKEGLTMTLENLDELLKKL